MRRAAPRPWRRGALAGLLLAAALATGGALRAQTPAGEPAPADPPTPHPDLRVAAPEAGAVISGTVTVTGEARGSWYFEADFPLRLVGADGEVLAEGFATAQEPWMTTAFVPFRGEIALPSGAAGPARLVLERANPSGLEANAAGVEIPISIVAEK